MLRDIVEARVEGQRKCVGQRNAMLANKGLQRQDLKIAEAGGQVLALLICESVC